MITIGRDEDATTLQPGQSYKSSELAINQLVNSMMQEVEGKAKDQRHDLGDKGDGADSGERGPQSSTASSNRSFTFATKEAAAATTSESSSPSNHSKSLFPLHR